MAGSPLLTAADSPLTSTTQTETVGAAAASKLVITTAPQTLTAGVTSNIIRVQLDDPFNNVATAAGTQTVLLTTSSTAPFGVHFRDAADTINITSVTISTGASSATFKYNDTLSGSPLLTVADSPLTSATQTETVSAAAASKLVIATLAQTLTAGVTSNTMTVQLDDPFNNVATAASTQTVLLTTSSTAPFGVHFRDTADTTNITSVTISTGASSASFKYNDTLSGSPLLTAADSPLTSATQTETVGAAAAIKLVLTTAPQTLTAGVTSGVITVQLDDPFNNVATAASTQTVLLTTSSTAPFGVHFRDTADTTNITSVAIGTGASSASFKYNDTLSGSPLLTVADAPLTSASQSETVNAAGASKLVITTGAQTLTAGVTSSLMTVQLDDSFSNVTSAASTQTVLLTTSSTAPFGVHFRDTADTTNITSVTIGAGASSASFKYNDTLAGSVVLTAADSPLTSATQSETVNAAAASKLVITTAAQTLTAGVTSNTITVQLDDPFNNAATATSTQTVMLTTSSTAPSGVHFRDTTDTSNITSVSISAGASTASFKYNDTLAGSPLLTAADSPLTSATQSETVNAAAASKLFVTIQPSTSATAGVPFAVQPVVVEQDAFGNLVVADSTQTVTAATGNHGSANLQGGSHLSVQLAGGVAAFAGLSYNKAEVMDIAFTSSLVSVSSVTSNDVTVSAQAPIGNQTISYNQGPLSISLRSNPTYQLQQAGTQAWFLGNQLALTEGLNSSNQPSFFASAGQKWFQGNFNQFGSPWYFIVPSGQLYAWNSLSGPNAGAPVVGGALDPIYFQFPDLLTNRSPETYAFVIEQRLSLVVGNLFENFSGLGERWLQSSASGTWYYLTPDGKLFAGGGAYLAALDPIYYAQPNRLANAQAGQINATLQPANGNIPPMLVVTPVNGYVGQWVIQLTSTLAGLSPPWKPSRSR